LRVRDPHRSRDELKSQQRVRDVLLRRNELGRECWRYQRFVRTLSAPEMPNGYLSWPALAMNPLLAATAVVGAVWIVCCS
jgi:hypothetical protein